MRRGRSDGGKCRTISKCNEFSIYSRLWDRSNASVRFDTAVEGRLWSEPSCGRINGCASGVSTAYALCLFAPVTCFPPRRGGRLFAGGVATLLHSNCHYWTHCASPAGKKWKSPFPNLFGFFCQQSECVTAVIIVQLFNIIPIRRYSNLFIEVSAFRTLNIYPYLRPNNITGRSSFRVCIMLPMNDEIAWNWITVGKRLRADGKCLRYVTTFESQCIWKACAYDCVLGWEEMERGTRGTWVQCEKRITSHRQGFFKAKTYSYSLPLFVVKVIKF